MSKRKVRFDMLVENTSVSIDRIKHQLSNPEVEISMLNKLIEEIALLNEKDSFEEEGELPASNTKKVWFEIANMTEVVLRLFAHELSVESKKRSRIKDILK